MEMFSPNSQICSLFFSRQYCRVVRLHMILKNSSSSGHEFDTFIYINIFSNCIDITDTIPESLSQPESMMTGTDYRRHLSCVNAYSQPPFCLNVLHESQHWKRHAWVSHTIEKYVYQHKKGRATKIRVYINTWCVSFCVPKSLEYTAIWPT